MSEARQTGPELSQRGVRQWAEFTVVRLLVSVLGSVPRWLGRWFGSRLGMVAYHALARMRRTGLDNLSLAFPAKSAAERDAILRECYRNLGRQLAEFCRMPHLRRGEAEQYIRYEGLEHYLRAREAGRGVLVLTAHLGAWELSSFFHSLVGFPMGLLIRRLDNERVDTLVNRIRCQHGNWVVHKDDFARGLITAMRAGKTVGILMDTNMTPPQGVFVPFFGRLACTAAGMARIAGKTGATVLPGFLTSDGEAGTYTLRFGEALTLESSGDVEADALANTAQFTAVIERYVRRFPEQWLWMHRRWKTRPPGEVSA